MPTGTMSADPGWTKTMNAKTMVTAWVWISLATLAWFAMAEEPCWDAGGALSDPPTLLSDSEPRVEKRSGGGFLPVPVWKFLKVSDGEDSSDFDRPHFRCGNMSLYLRFSLVRHSDLRLRDGRSLLLLLDRCHGSVWTFGPWLHLEFPYTSCHMALKISNGKWFRKMEVSYFDYLQQASMMTVLSCEHPAFSQCVAIPAVSCNSTNVTVKLPLGARLQRVKALDKDVVLRTLRTTPEAVFVQISTQSDTDSILEIIYLDSAGEMSTILATCTVKGSKQDRHQRGLWDLNVANYRYSRELSELIKARDKTEIMETETLCSEDSTVIVETQVTHSDSETINSPDGPDKSVTPACDDAEKQDDLPCCDPLDDLPCCEPLDDLPCCNLSEEDLSCHHEHEDPPSSQPPLGVHHGPFPGFSSSRYLHSQSTLNDSQHESHPSKGHSEGHPLGSQPSSDQTQSPSSHIIFTGSPPLSVKQTTSEHGSRPSKGHDKGHPSKGGEGSHPGGRGEVQPSKGHDEGRGVGRPFKGGETKLPDSQLSSVQSQSLSSHVPVTGNGSKTSSGGQSTSDPGGRPSKGHGERGPSKGDEADPPGSPTSSGDPPFLGGQLKLDHGGRLSKGSKGLPSKGHDKVHPSKGGERSRPGGRGEAQPSKGHDEGRGVGHPFKGGETKLPESQLSSVQSQSLSSHVPVTGNGSKTSSGGQYTADPGGRPSKGHGERGPSKGDEADPPGSTTSSGDPPFLGGQLKLDHGGRLSKGSKGLPSKGHDKVHREGLPSKGHDKGHPSKGGEGSHPGGRGEAQPSKGHDEGRGVGRPFKGGETRLPDSQLSSVQSPLLSSHVPVTGSSSKTSSGGLSTSDHGARPSKGHNVGSHEGHPSKGGKGHLSKGNDRG